MIYVSTSCLKNPSNVLRVLDEYDKAEIENVELGSVHVPFDVKKLKKFNFNFLVHNYFPPPKNTFNFNLASQNPQILKKSIKLAKNAIDLCVEIKSPLYTFHAGFTADPPRLGKPFPKKNIVDNNTAIITFFDSIEKIILYAKSRGIKIAMEPNVVQQFNLINEKNELLLFTDIPEIKLFFKKFKSNIGILLDLGHTSVTSHWLKYDKDEFVNFCKKRTFAIHISNNNGKMDQHKSLIKKCWQLSKLPMFSRIPIVLETMNLDIKKIKSNIRLVQEEISRS